MSTAYTENPKTSHDYEILETIEAGLVLEGHEVKAIKFGKATIKGAHVKIINGEPQLIGANISPYQPANTPPNYNPQRSRKLLLSKKQISTLIGTLKTRRLTLIPLKIYEKNNRLKLLIGIARGKKKYEKRETLKKKDIERALNRVI
jgi:SsrA-binding protein